MTEVLPVGPLIARLFVIHMSILIVGNLFICKHVTTREAPPSDNHQHNYVFLDLFEHWFNVFSPSFCGDCCGGASSRRLKLKIRYNCYKYLNKYM